MLMKVNENGPKLTGSLLCVNSQSNWCLEDKLILAKSFSVFADDPFLSEFTLTSKILNYRGK